jgi:ribonuclease P/MRP protein subunit POP7
MANHDHPPKASTSLESPFVSRPDGNRPRTAGSKASKISSTLLADIKFERKNKPQPRLPTNHKIQKRPIIHPPIAAPYAGPDAQKIVYVSRATPIMAAVKRVRKLLEQAEKRNLQREGVLGTGKRAGNKISAAQHKKAAKQEEVLVKGSGRAIEQAVRVAEWFKRHAQDGDSGWVVNVRPASVKVIDDIVEGPSAKADGELREEQPREDNGAEQGGLGQVQKNDGDMQKHDKSEEKGPRSESKPLEEHGQVYKAGDARHQKDLGSKKRKRPMYDEGDIPEARSRFIDAIEIAISMKG